MWWAWARFDDNGFEVSSAGNTTYSPLFARLADGRTIEEAYQLDVKGYRGRVTNWRAAKGRPSLRVVNLWYAYLDLWKQWAEENPEAMARLAVLARGKVLTDRYATGNVNQARALAHLLNKMHKPKVLNKRTATEAELEDSVYIGRPSKWGNPFAVGVNYSRDEAIDYYRRWLRGQPQLIAAAKVELRGRNLVCWCAPRACHGDILLDLVN